MGMKQIVLGVNKPVKLNVKVKNANAQEETTKKKKK